MSAVVCLCAVKASREAQTRAEAKVHQARLAEALRDAAEACETAIGEGDVETARDALAALICDAQAPEHMTAKTHDWRSATIHRLALDLMSLEDLMRVAILTESDAQ